MATRINKYLISKLVIYLILTIYVNSANSMQIDYSLEGGIEYTDNAYLSSIDPISSSIGRFDLIADITHMTNSVNFYMRPTVNVYDYQNELLEDRTFYGLDTSLIFEIVPNGFRWSFDDYLGQTLIDVTDPSTTFNTQTTNVFLTGPDLTLRLDNTRRIELLLRYANFYYEVEVLDNERLGGRLQLISQPNSFSEYSLNIDSADIKYEDTEINEDYIRNDAFITISRLMNLATISLDVGYTKIDRELSDELSGFIGRLDSQITINSRTNLNLYAHAQYTDSSRNFLQSRAYDERIRFFDTQISSDILYEKILYGGYYWRDDANSMTIEILKADQDYEELSNELDRDSKRANFEFNRNITRLTSFYFNALWQNTYYSQVSVDDKDNDYLMGIDYRLSRSFLFRLGIGYRKRNSTDTIRNYSENSAYMSIRYSNSR